MSTDQANPAPASALVDLCADCNVGEHLTCDDAAWRENGLCGCTSSRHEREQQSYEAMVERGAAALGTWINAKYPPAWALGAARVVLNAALAQPSGNAPRRSAEPAVGTRVGEREATAAEAASADRVVPPADAATGTTS